MENTGQKKSFLKAGLIESFIILVLIVIIVGILSFLNVIPLKSLFKFDHGKAPPAADTTQKQLTRNVQRVGFACPVPYTNCRDGVFLKYNSQPALLFTTPAKSPLFAAGDYLSFTSKDSTLGFDKVKVLSGSFIFEGWCYTATYTVPDSTSINDLHAPIDKGAVLGQSSGKYLVMQGMTYNVLTQIQRRALDTDTKKTDTQKCSNDNLTPDKYGEFMPFTALNYD
ncbi:MAG: hypothetical protein ACM3IJ_01755 [Candidatus Levyibacteriota bacterium]